MYLVVCVCVCVFSVFVGMLHTCCDKCNYTCMAIYSYSLLFLILVSPLIQLSIFCISYGTDLKDIKVYVTNLDDLPSNCTTQLQYWDHGGLSTLQCPLHDGSIHSDP